jgi:hypothetical protein
MDHLAETDDLGEFDLPKSGLDELDTVLAARDRVGRHEILMSTRAMCPPGRFR